MAAPPPQQPKKKSSLPLILGIGCGVLILLSICGSLAAFGVSRYLAQASMAGSSSDSKADSDKKADSGGGGDAIGVASCDEYIKKMNACADKVGEPGGAAIRDAAKQTSQAWRDAIKDGGEPVKAGLAQGCTAALDASKQAYAAMGCEF